MHPLEKDAHILSYNQDTAARALAEKKPLVFHFVRLAGPSDAPFLPILPKEPE